MVADVRKTNQLAKLGARVAKAHEAHKNDETKYGIVDLPAGIKRGRAKLATCKFAEYKEGKNKGELYAMFRSIAETPEIHDGTRVRGQGVMQMIPLCDTVKTKDGKEVTTTFEEHWAELLNELRKFGLNTAAMPNHNVVEAAMLSLENSHPQHWYSTRGWTPPKTQKDPNPKEMVFVQFDGVLTSEELASEPAPSPSSGFAEPEGGGGGDDAGSGSDTASGGEDFDLADIAQNAETGDMSAIDLMKDAARKVGITEDEIDNSSSWVSQGEGTSLYEMIVAKQSEGEGQTGEPEAPAWEPKVGATCTYTVKAGGKQKQVKIEKIDKKAETADLLDLADKKTKIAKVPFAKLSAA